MGDIGELLKISTLICCVKVGKNDSRETLYGADNLPINDKYNVIKDKYKAKVNKFDTVWILVGDNGKTKKIIQVGKSSSRENMLKNDIIPDVKRIIGQHPKNDTEKSKKYRKILTGDKGYCSLSFYEVSMRKYLKKDRRFHKWFGITINRYYNRIYSRIMAGYCEGKIAAVFGAGDGETGGIWYRSDGIEGIVFDMYHGKYVKPKKEAEENADDKGGKL